MLYKGTVNEVLIFKLGTEYLIKYPNVKYRTEIHSLRVKTTFWTCFFPLIFDCYFSHFRSH